MNIDATFLPVAVELIDNVFPTEIVFKKQKDLQYDPLTGGVVYVSAGAPPVLAGYANASVVCGISSTGDYQSSDIVNGTTSICDDPALPAGTAEYDNADVQPRSAIDSPINGWTKYPIKAGVLSRKRLEEGGTNETYEIALWVHHGASGLGFLPTTADSFTYDGVVWKVTTVDPTYSSKTLIASKITGRG